VTLNWQKMTCSVGSRFDLIYETKIEKWIQTLEIFLFILVPVKAEFYCRVRKCILKHLKE